MLYINLYCVQSVIYSTVINILKLYNSCHNVQKLGKIWATVIMAKQAHITFRLLLYTLSLYVYVLGSITFRYILNLTYIGICRASYIYIRLLNYESGYGDTQDAGYYYTTVIHNVYSIYIYIVILKQV